MPDTPLHVGLLYGGQSSEHDVSIQSASSTFDALARDRYRVTPLYIDRDGRWHAEDAETAVFTGHNLAAGALRLCFAPAAERPVFLGDDGDPLDLDVVIPMLHGQNGEDGRVQGLLHTLGVPFVGPGVLGSAACMDKEVTKRLLRDAGLPIVPFRVVRRGETLAWADAVDALGETLFVKPANSGSSVGTAKAESEEELQHALADAFRYDHKVLVETAIQGREIEVAVLGNDEPRASAPGEVVSTAQFYTYESKYTDEDSSHMEVPADLAPDRAATIRDLAVRAYRVLGCEGLARVDFFVTDDAHFVNEINTIPGFTKRSMYPVMWAHEGLPIDALLDELIRLALERDARDADLKTSR